MLNAVHNTPKDVMEYFSVPEKGTCTDSPSDGKVSLSEYRAFWSSLNDAEKDFWRTVKLG